MEKLKFYSNPVKALAINLEKKSFENSPISEEANSIVDEVIQNSTNDMFFDICLQNGIEKKCKGEWGLKLHKSKSHKKNNLLID
ncbi:unnamed protein product [Brachionus calyciflorus]|uniref:Uncharacterized protein n=1 Tax=Brachionus calyciflorus TaxID=104777 RepID=A0A814HL00_9BILA|nr:unnamed protein product [Brachionus calyciflorus]